MQDNIGRIYEVVASVIGLVGGVLIIIFRKKFLEAQKRYLSKRKDFLNQKMLESVQSRSDKNSYVLIVIIALILIIGGIYQLITIL